MCEPKHDGKFILHAIQLQPQKYCKAFEFYKMIYLPQQADSVHSFAVQDASVLEVVIAKWWASPGEVKINYSVSFHGLKPSQSHVVMVTIFHRIHTRHVVDSVLRSVILFFFFPLFFLVNFSMQVTVFIGLMCFLPSVMTSYRLV